MNTPPHQTEVRGRVAMHSHTTQWWVDLHQYTPAPHRSRWIYSNTFPHHTEVGGVVVIHSHTKPVGKDVTM